MKQLIIETIKAALLEQPKKAPMLNESKQYNSPISEAMRYHLNNQIQINDNIYRPGSSAHIELIHEARILWKQGIIELLAEDKKLFENTDLGRFGMFVGEIGMLEGVIFSNWKQIDVLPKEAKLIGIGLDFGYTNDPTSAIEIYNYYSVRTFLCLN